MFLTSLIPLKHTISLNVDGIDGLCIFLQRFASPCRYVNLIPYFGRVVPGYSMITNTILDHVYDTFSHSAEITKILSGLNDALVRMREVCITVIKVHALLFQSVSLPNGITRNMYGPIEDRRHHCFLLRMPGLLTKLQQFAFNPNGNPLCIYGDTACPL